MDITTLALAKNLFNNATKNEIKYEKISNLPEKGEKGVIYFLTRDDGSFSEYMYIDETWELLGSSGEISLSWNDLADKPFGEEFIKSEEPDILLYASELIHDGGLWHEFISDWTIVPSENPYLVTLTQEQGYRIGADMGTYSIKLKIIGSFKDGYNFEILEVNDLNNDGGRPANGDSFYFYATNNGKLALILNSDYVEYQGGYLSIYGFERTIVNTLDDKYISENIARTNWVEKQIGDINSILATLSSGGVE